jgi:hypothetical protein
VIAGVLAEGAAELGRLGPLLELVELGLMADRLAVNGILEAFEERLEVSHSLLHRGEPLLPPAGRDGSILPARLLAVVLEHTLQQTRDAGRAASRVAVWHGLAWLVATTALAVVATPVAARPSGR